MYRRILENSPEGIWAMNLDGGILFSNRRIAEILRRPIGLLAGQSCFDFVFPEDAEEARRRFSVALGGDTRSFDFRLRRADESAAWVHISYAAIANGGRDPASLVGFFTEILEPKPGEDIRRSDALLRGDEADFLRLIETSPVITWTNGPDNRATFYNAAALSFAGHTLEEMIGNEYQQFIHPDDRDAYLRASFQASGAQSPFSSEARFRRADGKYRWLLVSGVPRFASGRYVGHVVTGIDVTELKQSYEHHLAAQKLESLGVLAAGISHDFNNLLNVVIAHAEEAESSLVPGSTALEAISQIHRTAIRASEVASQLMAFARQETVPITRLNLSTLVAEMLELMKFTTPKTVSIETRLSPKLPAIQANASEVRQVIMNLLLNASEAMHGKPGTIFISTSEAPAAAGAGPFVRLEVQDTGCGMSDELRTRIFDPFFTTRAAGRGLGLFSVLSIVRRHGGSIQLETAPGKGSRFTILFPATL
jgi:PAS domain S-box-containing protein